MLYFLLLIFIKKIQLKKKLRLFIIALIVAVFALIKGSDWMSNSPAMSDDQASYRNTSDLVLTKHVRCRMDCRQVTLQEITDIIENGKVNYNKSGIGKKGDSTFALEGISSDKQHLRVVVAPEKNGKLVVITCIDLEKEWPCNCN